MAEDCDLPALHMLSNSLCKGRAGLVLPALPEFGPCPDYLIVKYQDLAPTFFAASVATIFTGFLPLESFGEL